MFIAAVMSASSSAYAVQPDEIMADPVKEARARDLRLLVRERIAAGDSNAQVIDFLVARYGEFVLLKPRLEPHTLLLWGLPPAALLAGMLGLILMARRRNQKNLVPEALSTEEQRRLSTLVDPAVPKH